MAYKNSGAMKFNDATDLVIRADPDGTVESCLNNADGIEYVGSYSPAKNVDVTINNTTAATRTLYVAAVNANGLIAPASASVNANSTINVQLLDNGLLATTSNYTFEIVSGQGAVAANTVAIVGDTEVNIIPA